jgi:hypothetical protein
MRKKKEKFSHIEYKEIQKGAVASHKTNGLLMYDFATAPF